MLREENVRAEWPDPRLLVGESVDILLEYAGVIPSDQDGGHTDVKQKIRLSFSRQLKRHWRRGLLAEFYERGIPSVPYVRHHQTIVPDTERNPFFRATVCGFSVVPLVTYHNWLGCEIDFVFFGDERGVIDFDNQIKLVFDALRMPQHDREVPGNMFGKGGDLYCVLEDDSLVKKYSVESRYGGGGSPPDEKLHVNLALTYSAQGHCHPALDRFR